MAVSHELIILDDGSFRNRLENAALTDMRATSDKGVMIDILNAASPASVTGMWICRNFMSEGLEGLEIPAAYRMITDRYLQHITIDPKAK